MNYDEILANLMDAVDPAALVEGFQPVTHRPTMSQEEVEQWRRKTPREKVDLAESMALLALRTNPEGTKSVIRSRLRQGRP